MPEYTYETTTHLPAERLFHAIIDIRRWPEWNVDLQATTLDETVRAGTPFTLTPKGGPQVRMRVERADAPHLFVDVARLPLARMRTTHEFTAIAGCTRLRTTIELSGPLAFLWDRLIARKEAAGAAHQARQFLAFAEALAS